MNLILEINLSGILNEKDIFDYVVILISALGSLATGGALWVVYGQFQMAAVQQFESNFFQMLGLHNRLVSDIKKDQATVFLDAKQNIKNLFVNNIDTIGGGSFPFPVELHTTADVKAILDERYYDKYYHDYEDKFNHYFRNLYHLFKFIYQSKAILPDEKSRYVAIARAQLSQNELFALYFNALIDGYGNPKFLYLIKEYNLLDNFRVDEIEQQLVKDYFTELSNNVRRPVDFI